MKNKPSYSRRFADLALSSKILTDPSIDNQTKEDYLTYMFASVRIVGKQFAISMLKELIEEEQAAMDLDDDQDSLYIRTSQQIVLNKLLKQMKRKDRALQKIQNKLFDKVHRIIDKK